MSFFDQLQPASLAGIPFGVLGGEGRFGRRVQVHEYAFRDTPWVEDLGRSARKIGMVGFLVENDAVSGAGDVIAQRNAMIAAVEGPGPLKLVHPTLGTLSVSVPDGGFAVAERWEEGRYFELSFTFIEAGKKLFPQVSVSTGNAVNSAFVAANTAVGGDFLSSVSGPFSMGATIIRQAVQTAAQWGALAASLGSDASAAYNMTAELQGNNGRFYGGAVSGFLANKAPVAGPAPTAASLIAQGAANLAAIMGAIDALNQAAAQGSASAIVASAQSLCASVLDTTVDPSDAIRLLTALADFTPADFTTNDVVGQGMATVQIAMGNLFRRSTVVTLANASSGYQPSSADDATSVRNTVTGLLDDEIDIAGDSGEDDSFGALRALRQAVVVDLNTRGAGLPALKTFTYQASLPAAVLALRIYRDPSRSAQLVSEANPPHPSFMPTSFQALTS